MESVMATIRDIAAKAGVSPAAVSRILSNDPGLSVAPATRKRVLDCAAELGYSRKRTRDKSGFKIARRTCYNLTRWASFSGSRRKKS